MERSCGGITLDVNKMKTVNITISGLTPSKKNNVNLICRNNFVRKFPSNRYLAWQKDAVIEIQTQTKERGIDSASISLKIFSDTKRKADLTNKAESVMDALVDAGVLEDDNWFVCGDVRLLFGGVDKDNPRAEVEINKAIRHLEN